MPTEERSPTIELIRDDSADWVNPYPWRFAITYKGIRHTYGGIPNQLATAAEALERAEERLKWMDEGTYQEQYR